MFKKLVLPKCHHSAKYKYKAKHILIIIVEEKTADMNINMHKDHKNTWRYCY